MRNVRLPEVSPHRKLIILDPSLKDVGGHYYEYDAAIAIAAGTQSLRSLIYAHKRYDTGLAIADVEIRPWFTTEWSAAGGRSRSAARHVLSKLPVALRIPLAKLGQCVWGALKKRRKKMAQAVTVSKAARDFAHEAVESLRDAACGAGDMIFLPTLRTSELFALWRAVQHDPELGALQFHVVLRRDAAEMNLPEDGAPGIAPLFKEMAGTSSFHFYCDTKPLCDDYAALSSGKLTFGLLPIPFPDTAPDPASLEKWSAGAAIKLVYLGGARVEKGFHLIAAAEQTLRPKLAGRILWRLQAPDTGLEEPEVISARQRLSSIRDGSVDLVARNLTSAEFQSLLLSADIVLLPYLAEFYQGRSSGILVQVLAVGKPVIVPAKSWLASQTKGIGAMEFQNADDLADVILRAVEDHNRLVREAEGRAAAYAAFHSAGALVAMLKNQHTQ